MKNINEKIGMKIRTFREYMGLTQEHVATILKVGRDAIIRIEKGSRKLTAEELMNFSKLFNVSIEELTEDNYNVTFNDTIFARGFNELSEKDKKEILDLIKFKNEMKSRDSYHDY